jgi:hypothetical protein
MWKARLLSRKSEVRRVLVANLKYQKDESLNTVTSMKYMNARPRFLRSPKRHLLKPASRSLTAPCSFIQTFTSLRTEYTIGDHSIASDNPFLSFVIGISAWGSSRQQAHPLFGQPNLPHILTSFPSLTTLCCPKATTPASCVTNFRPCEPTPIVMRT